MPRTDKSSITNGTLLKRTARVGALTLKSRQFPLMSQNKNLRLTCRDELLLVLLQMGYAM